jgi:hypothetical protein
LLSLAAAIQRGRADPGLGIGTGPAEPPPLEKQVAEALGVSQAVVNVIAGRILPVGRGG